MSDKRDFTEKYNTQLTPEEEPKYAEWLINEFGYDPKNLEKAVYDYDMRGAFKANLQMDSNKHLADTYKKPNHPTFSTQSQYSGADGYIGGNWEKIDEKRWKYTPSDAVLNLHGIENMKKYWDRVEKAGGHELNLPPMYDSKTISKFIDEGKEVPAWVLREIDPKLVDE